MKIAVLSDIYGNGIALNYVIKDMEKEKINLCGHSHCSFIGEVSGKKILNPGSIGNSLDKDNRASYGILDFLEEKVKLINKKVAYPINEVLEIAKKNNFPYFDEYRMMVESGNVN